MTYKYLLVLFKERKIVHNILKYIWPQEYDLYWLSSFSGKTVTMFSLEYNRLFHDYLSEQVQFDGRYLLLNCLTGPNCIDLETNKVFKSNISIKTIEQDSFILAIGSILKYHNNENKIVQTKKYNENILTVEYTRQLALKCATIYNIKNKKIVTVNGTCNICDLDGSNSYSVLINSITLYDNYIIYGAFKDNLLYTSKNKLKIYSLDMNTKICHHLIDITVNSKQKHISLFAFKKLIIVLEWRDALEVKTVLYVHLINIDID